MIGVSMRVTPNRFYPLAKKAGVPISPQDFSGPSPTGMHFVRVQVVGVT